MSDLQLSIGYKLATIVGSLAIIYWGYRLFHKGFTSTEGNLSAFWGNSKIVLQNTAPGVFFALFGSVVFFIAVFRGIDIRSKEIQNSNTVAATEYFAFADTALLTTKKWISIDSLYELGNRSLHAKQYLDAYKFYILVKGATYRDTCLQFPRLDSNIITTMTSLKSLLTVKAEPYHSEEIKSIIINQEYLDTPGKKR